MSLESLKEMAFKRIRADIVSNILLPGQSLNERELSTQLKISKTPIREAIQLLYKEGFVHVIPQKGSFVSTVTLTDIREIMQIREGLEPIAAGEAALKRDPTKIQELEKSLTMLAQDAKRDRQIMSDLGNQFHLFLIETSGNQRLINILKNLNIHMDRIRAIFCFRNTFDYHDQALSEHRAIARAVLDQDSREAERLMRAHIERYWRILRDMA